MGNNCTGCGSQNDDGARLCRDCGKAIVRIELKCIEIPTGVSR